MKRISSYRIYICLSAALALLSACGSSRKATTSTSPETHASKEKEIKEKYASIVGISAHDIEYPLYSFIDAWYGAPYKYGGHSRDGVDCSDFVSILFDKVYNAAVSGPCVDLLSMCKSVKEAELKEGDLVFFEINSKHVSHVGVYLCNNKFVHASVHSGVVISDLTDAYYKKYFYKAGRLKTSLSQNTYKG